MSPFDPSLLDTGPHGPFESFHDAEIDRVELRAGLNEGLDPYIVIDVRPVVVGRSEAEVLTIRFESVTDVELHDFGMQNVLFDLDLQEIQSEDGRPRLAVALQSSFNLGGAFECARATVVSVKPIT